MSKILVVDDDAAIRMLYADELEEEGYDVITWGEAYRLMELVADESPDLIVMDGIIAFVARGPMEGTRVEANVFVSGTDKIAIDAVVVAILRILGTTPEVTKGPIFDQDQIRRAVDLGIGVSSPKDIEFLTDSKASEELVTQIKEELWY